MSEQKDLNNAVVVSGDFLIDWNLACGRKVAAGSTMLKSAGEMHFTWAPGGAGLLANLVEAGLAAAGAAGRQVCKPAGPQGDLIPGDPRFTHAYTLWSAFKYSEKPGQEKEKPAWRMDEFLGQEGGEGTIPLPEPDAPDADLVVLLDAGLGFRDRPECWPAALHNPARRPWVVLQTAAPVASGRLWEHLYAHFADRLIVVMSVDDLRFTEVQISRELSWERTAQDVVWELSHNPQVNALSRCAAVVISFNAAGAVLMAGGAANSSLFFDPRGIEGMWEADFPGGMTGYSTCLAAALACRCACDPGGPDLARAVRGGLAGMRKLHAEGYGERGAAGTRLIFPFKTVAAEIVRGEGPFAQVTIQDPGRFLTAQAAADCLPDQDGFWTILNDCYQDNLGQVAQEIVLYGPEAVLTGVPLGVFGGLLTVDRREIESFRAIRSLIGEYCRQGQQKKPLSIAVFGSPGSGKSFGIIQVASSLLPGQIQVLEFNLSQFNQVKDLLDALHQVRDVGLSGKIPLVFWDEFDTPLDGKRLGWLRYFLAPMQDGRFQEGQLSHPIGRCIFVFAGGTSYSIDHFNQALPEEEFRAAKGPDFVSRLKGFVNILGPNRLGEGRADAFYIIRRAILLRSILKRNAGQLFQKKDGKDRLNIDRGVLRAMLETPVYKHGVRSMESVIAMSQLSGKSAYERSCLPSEAQLDLHVDGRDFLSIVQQLDLSGPLLDQLAEAAHEIFCQHLRERGYQYGPVSDDARRLHSSLVPYAGLPEDEKQQNISNVLDILAKLDQAGYVMAPARSNEPPFDFPGPELERLARMEHERWVNQKLAAGWHYAPQTDKAQRLHNCLVPWQDLPADEKEKDYELVRGIPRILARAGYAVLKSRRSA